MWRVRSGPARWTTSGAAAPWTRRVRHRSERRVGRRRGCGPSIVGTPRRGPHRGALVLGRAVLRSLWSSRPSPLTCRRALRGSRVSAPNSPHHSSNPQVRSQGKAAARLHRPNLGNCKSHHDSPTWFRHCAEPSEISLQRDRAGVNARRRWTYVVTFCPHDPATAGLTATSPVARLVRFRRCAPGGAEGGVGRRGGRPRRWHRRAGRGVRWRGASVRRGREFRRVRRLRER